MLKKNIFSVLVAITIMYLSLASSQTFESVPVLIDIPNFDKFVHFIMYFSLMAVIIFENRISLRSTKRLLIVSIIPLAYGILIEFLQSSITTDRSGSIYDAMADAAGIYLALVIGLYFLKRFPSDTY